MKRSITHFNVGNGNCSLIEAEDFVLIIDLNKTEDKDSSYDLLKPFFRKRNGIDCIDVLCITHGDKDHCQGFRQFKNKIDSGDLIIGSIWHQGFDRTINNNKEDLPDDYLALQDEIDCRKKIFNPSFGDIEKALKAKDDDSVAFNGLEKPDEFNVRVLSPFSFDDENSGYDHNDLSLIINFEINQKNFLYTGDAQGKYWQERIMPYLLNDKNYRDWAEAEILEVGHHGSFDFFGADRETVRDSQNEPDNYEALDRINPDDLIISAASKFPTNGDSSGEDPPHYAAWKWYHKWFRDNHGVSEDDKHPEQFKYTSDGDVRLEYDESKWNWNMDWDHNEKQKENLQKQAQKISEQMNKGSLIIGSGLNVPRNPGYYGSNI